MKIFLFHRHLSSHWINSHWWGRGFRHIVRSSCLHPFAPVRHPALPVSVEALAREEKEEVARHTASTPVAGVVVAVCCDAVAWELALETRGGVGLADKAGVAGPLRASRFGGPRGVDGKKGSVAGGADHVGVGGAVREGVGTYWTCGTWNAFGVRQIGALLQVGHPLFASGRRASVAGDGVVVRVESVPGRNVRP